MTMRKRLHDTNTGQDAEVEDAAQQKRQRIDASPSAGAKALIAENELYSSRAATQEHQKGPNYSATKASL